jgi:hypothetical protein
MMITRIPFIVPALFMGWQVLTTPAYSFDSFEHIWIGDSLSLPNQIPTYTEAEYPYREHVAKMRELFASPEFRAQLRGKADLPYPHAPAKIDLGNGRHLSFGELIAIFGDYLAPIGRWETIAKQNWQNMFPPAGSGATAAAPIALEQLLVEAAPVEVMVRYATNATDRIFKLQSKIPDYRAFFTKEFTQFVEIATEAVDAGKSAGYFPNLHEIYVGHHSLLEKFWNARISGATYLSQHYSTILAQNLDHFGNDARETYLYAHVLALHYAHQRELNKALIAEAVADHYLSDLFAAGHLRTPRRALVDSGLDTMGTYARVMHDEDGYWGLLVSNQVSNGNTWIAYGDGSYFAIAESEDNRFAIMRALQAGIDEIVRVYHGDAIPTFSQLATLAHLPWVDERGHNYAPLFLQDRSSKAMYLRKGRDINPEDSARIYAELSRRSLMSWAHLATSSAERIGWDHKSPSGYFQHLMLNEPSLSHRGHDLQIQCTYRDGSTKDLSKIFHGFFVESLPQSLSYTLREESDDISGYVLADTYDPEYSHHAQQLILALCEGDEGADDTQGATLRSVRAWIKNASFLGSLFDGYPLYYYYGSNETLAPIL